MESKEESEDDIMNLSVSKIGAMSTKELYKYMQILDIRDFYDISQLKDQIILRVMKIKETVIETRFYTKDFKEKKEMTVREDELRRQYLDKCVQEIESIYYDIKKLKKIKITSMIGINLSERDDPLYSKIENEFVNIEQKFQRTKELVSKQPRCALLICGDSCSGKSSFINLLINGSLLPTSIRCNTACQVRLTYDQHERAEVLDHEDKIITIDKRNFPENLNKYLENLDQRKSLSCKGATIYLNCPVLEDGLDIYDTIGYGETEYFNEELTKDLKDITGIIFLLKKNNSIGDSTVGGLSKIINHMAKNGIPGGSMYFIINMCDLLEGIREKADLKKNLTEQIRDKCAGLNPEITTFSTKLEMFLQENQCMSRDYEIIMKLIQNLHLNSINTNTVSIFEFLFRFVWKTLEYINESEDFAKSDRAHKKMYIQKLRNLEADRKLLNQIFKKKNEKFLQEKFNELKKEFENHFNSKETRLRVLNEVVNDHMQLIGIPNENDIERQIIMLTQKGILNSFRKLIEERNLLKNCCNEMLTTFLQQFAEHQKKKDSINQEMNRHIDSVMNYIEDDLPKINVNDLIGLPNYQRKILQLFSPIMVPGIEFKNKIKKEIDCLFLSVFSRMDLSNVRTIYRDPHRYISQKSAQYYDKFANGKHIIEKIINCLFEAPRQVTRDFEKHLADDMNYLSKNIDLLQEDMSIRKNIIPTYKVIKEKLETIYDELCKINLLYLQQEKKDVMRERIEIFSSPDHQIDNQTTRILFNRNRVVYYGHFRDIPKTDSAILVYKNVDGKSWKDLYEEYTKHKEISKLVMEKDRSDQMQCFITLRFHIISSLNDKNDLNPMFFVNGVDHSLKTFIKEYKSTIENSDHRDTYLLFEINRLISQILKGLQYLHNHQLVHYDLTMDSIGYTSTYSSIKLSSISLKTSVKIDHSSTSRNYVHEVSHFPRDILDKNSLEKYTPKSDIYCLGIILYQLWTDIDPFFDLIESREIDTVEQFVGILKIKKIGDLILTDKFQGGCAKTIYSWIIRCFENKFTANSFYDYLKDPINYGTT